MARRRIAVQNISINSPCTRLVPSPSLALISKGLGVRPRSKADAIIAPTNYNKTGK